MGSQYQFDAVDLIQTTSCLEPGKGSDWRWHGLPHQVVRTWTLSHARRRWLHFGAWLAENWDTFPATKYTCLSGVFFFTFVNRYKTELRFECESIFSPTFTFQLCGFCWCKGTMWNNVFERGIGMFGFSTSRAASSRVWELLSWGGQQSSLTS